MLTYKTKINTALTIAIALVWLINGLFCKVLDLVPRHQLIVARILGEDHALFFTKTIGVLEMMMVLWIFSKIKVRWCALFQIIIVVTMNIIEFVLAPDLLLFGKINILVAAFFISVVFLNEFVLNNTRSK